MTSPVIEKASDWINLSDEQLASMIERPGAAEALHAADDVTPEPAATPEPKAPEVAPAPEPAAVAKPEPAPPEAPEPPKPAYTPITKFALKDSTGELDEADASQNLRFDFKANNKDYTDVPLDKVVKWAQMGVYNEERESQVNAARQFVTEAQQALEEKDQQLSDFDTYARRLLHDPKFFAEAQAVYNQHNTPEARARRAEEQLENYQAQSAVATEDRQISDFVNSALTPAVIKLTQENPDVRYEEIIGRFTVLTAPLLVRGRIPTQALAAVQHLVQNELMPWVEQAQSDRSRTKTVAVKKVEEAQTKTALAKRQLARRVAPPSASAPAQPKSKKYGTAKDWLNDLLPNARDDDN